MSRLPDGYAQNFGLESNQGQSQFISHPSSQNYYQTPHGDVISLDNLHT
jgi:hypothetical protein